MARFANSVLFTSTLGGTTDFVVSANVTGYMTPASAGAPTGVYKYRAESSDLSQWEIGEGTYTSGTTTLTRTTVLYNSAGTGTATGQSGAGSKINFTVAPNVSIGLQTVEDTIGVDQSNVFTYLQKAQVRANIDVLKKNYIVNGAMMVSQERGNSAGTTAGYYPVDEFLVDFSTTGALSIAQVASPTPAGSPNRLRVTVTTADASVAAGDVLYIRQRIEGFRVSDLLFGTASARTITIQFGVKAPAGTYSVVVANSANNRSYVAEYVISGGEANTDVVKSVTIPGDTAGTWLTGNGIGLNVRWGLMAGTTFQQAAGSWSTGNPFGSPSQFNLMGTVSNVFELFDVGLYVGSVAPAFQVPDYCTQLALCMRYWESTYSPGTVPGTATIDGAEHLALNHTANFSTGGTGKGFSWKVSKRAAPTITPYSPNTGASGQGHDFVAGVDKVPAIVNVGLNGFRWQQAANANNNVYSMAVHFVMNARL